MRLPLNALTLLLGMVGACGGSAEQTPDGSLIVDRAPNDTALSDGFGAHESNTAPFTILFRTGFEVGEAEGIPADAHEQLLLKNTAEGSTSTDPLPFRIVYEGGTVADRYARLVEDPSKPGNGVLQFWMKNATIVDGYKDHKKGRVQTHIDLREATSPVDILYFTQRIYIHPDIALMAQYPETADPWWLSIMLQEYWFGSTFFDHPNPARISVYLSYDASGKLRLAAHGQKTPSPTNPQWGDLWHSQDPDYGVPTGTWLTLEVGYKRGDAETGRFVITAQAEGETEPTTIVNVTNWTYNPDALLSTGTGPVPLTLWSPQKLYASDNSLHFIRDSGGVAQIYWDDFAFALSWPPNWPR
ncbi:MAG: hypothetical protein JRH20_23710 [Deltaproteobacteria bacterium]|nr:hypothetical protein [Deltaproteobacteria bacterium]